MLFTTHFLRSTKIPLSTRSNRWNRDGFRLISTKTPKRVTVKHLHKLCQMGDMKEAVQVLHRLAKQGIRPDYKTYLQLLDRCSTLKALNEGKSIHSHMINTAVNLDLYLRNSLIAMYLKCSGFRDARKVFDKMPERNVASWTSMISMSARRGLGDEGLGYFLRMRRGGIEMEPNQNTFSVVIGICCLQRRFRFGIALHCDVWKRGFNGDVFVCSNLISMYSKFDFIDDARKVFDEMPERDAVSWNSMIAAYAGSGLGEEAVSLFSIMLTEDFRISVNNFTIASVLKACGGSGRVKIGKSLHSYVIKFGIDLDLFVIGSLIDMYSKCGSLGISRRVFDQMSSRDLVVWNTMITGYAQNSYGEEAVILFCELQAEGFVPNQITFASILNSLASLADIVLGRIFHALVIKHGCLSDVFVSSALVNMYSKCLDMEDAERAFAEMRKINLVSFNTLITGYSLSGSYEEAMNVYGKLREKNMKPDAFTFTGLLSSFAVLGALAEGTQVHAHTIKAGLDSNVSVGNSVVNLYAKCGFMTDASKALESITEPNTISWAGIISGFAQNGEGENALLYFSKMHKLSEKLDEFSLTSVLKACANWASAEQGKHIHGYVIKTGLESSIFIGSALVDLYSKCGIIKDSCKVFDKMPVKNVVSWNSMIMGFAQNGFGKKSLQNFQEMKACGVKPTCVTFIGVLFACSHEGFIDEGRFYFDTMTLDYGISPSIEHYTCLVDLLGRVGYLREAETFLQNSPFSSEPTIWRSLLAACRVHKNMDVGLRVANRCLLLEPQEPATYVLLSNIYASKKLWGEVTRIRNLMREMGIEKEPGCSWVQSGNMVHVFVAEDKSHPQRDEIFWILETLTIEMKMMGYFPDTCFMLQSLRYT